MATLDLHLKKKILTAKTIMGAAYYKDKNSVLNFVYLILSAFTLCVHGMGIKELIALSSRQPKIPYQWNQLEFNFPNHYARQQAENNGNLKPSHAFSMALSSRQPKIPYQWNQLEFNFPNHHARQQAEDSGNLKPSHAFPIDVQPHYYHKNRLRTFVTVPRLRDGVPFTLATVSDEQGINGPLLEPYPNYEIHNNNNGKNCDAISSAFRVAINECNEMWVIDSGFVGPDSQCPPQLLLFDLNTDQLIHRYQFKATLYTPKASLFVNPMVVVRDPPPRGSCQHTMVYVADAKYHGLVVYDLMQNNAWRIENKFMYPDPNHALLSIDGERFILIDGILGLATDKTNLYFHPLASATEYAAPLKVLDNSTLFENNKGNMYEAFIPLGTRKSECVASAMDSNHNLYCVTLDPIELIMWNVHTPYNIYNIKKLPMNPEILQFVSGMKVVRNHHGIEELWMLSNRSQKIVAGTQDFNEVNFRIVVLSLANRSFLHKIGLSKAKRFNLHK